MPDRPRGEDRIRGVDIREELAKLPVLHGRTPTTPRDEAGAAFAMLGTMNGASLYTGSFDGQSAWERHGHGDELVQIVAGATTLTILSEDGPVELELKAGMLTVVPQGCWHRFRAPGGVTVLTATPQPTDESSADDPCQEPESA